MPQAIRFDEADSCIGESPERKSDDFAFGDSVRRVKNGLRDVPTRIQMKVTDEMLCELADVSVRQ